MRRTPVLILVGVSAFAAHGQPIPGGRPTPLPATAPLSELGSTKAADPSDAFFAGDSGVPELTIVLTAENMDKLRGDPRVYVPFTLQENGKAVGEGGIKLKGAAGSFRDLDDRPALTINLDKFGGKALFHGIDKFHLNNSVQDESFLNEWVCTEVFRAAGYPATRVAHARVKLNDRDLGVYVLKEGFDGRFLKRHFGVSTGNFYDGGFCQDLDAELELDSGKGPKDRADLRRIVEACNEPDAERRWTALGSLVDLDALAKFVTLERITAHWDGYTHNRNNYRVYFAPNSGGKAWFLPHGMDQTFNDTGFELLGGPQGMVAAAFLADERGRTKHREATDRFVAAFDPADLARKIDAVQKRLTPALTKINQETADAQVERVRELVQRLRERKQNMTDQLRGPIEPSTAVFPIGEAVVIADWQTAAETEAVHEEIEKDGVAYLRIAASGDERCIASWRHTIRLPRGEYAFESNLKTESVEPLDDEHPGRGAGIRVSGGTRAAAGVGDSQATQQFQFAVPGDTDVVLVIELRAAKGSVLIRKDSITLKRVTPNMPGDRK